MSTSLFARNLARCTLQHGLRSSSSRVAPQGFGALRFATTYFTPAHEYVTVDGKVGTCGITDFAQAALGDIVYVDLPEVGAEYEKGDAFGSVESVKAASDVYAPVTGTILEVNEAITDSPDLVNSAAQTEGWFIKVQISDESELSSLMDEAAYKEHCEKEG